jgi:lysine 2,3-aminomutase
LLTLLGKADGTTAVAVNGITLPSRLLVAILEVLLPGDKFVSVKTVDQLEKLANIRVPDVLRADMQQVIETYPVRLSMHTIRQMRVSWNVTYQYLPFIEELGSIGHTNTWIGQFHQGLLEQMYANRVIFLLNMSCPVYCRFCFRKHKESRNETNPSVADVRKAVDHVRRSPAVKEIVITGGDPFMNRANMAAAIDGLMEVDHVQTLRLATRSIAYYPHCFWPRTAPTSPISNVKTWNSRNAANEWKWPPTSFIPTRYHPRACPSSPNWCKAALRSMSKHPF